MPTTAEAIAVCDGLDIDVQYACRDDDTPDEATIRSWIGAALERHGEVAASEVSVRIVDELEMRELNATYRQQDKPTNVLSFPASSPQVPESIATLGDIVICAPVVSAEAEAQGKRGEDHWAHLLIHGTLHLLGYDHDDDAEAARMEALETEILAARGIADPYAA